MTVVINNLAREQWALDRGLGYFNKDNLDYGLTNYVRLFFICLSLQGNSVTYF